MAHNKVGSASSSLDLTPGGEAGATLQWQLAPKWQWNIMWCRGQPPAWFASRFCCAPCAYNCGLLGWCHLPCG